MKLTFLALLVLVACFSCAYAGQLETLYSELSEFRPEALAAGLMDIPPAPAPEAGAYGVSTNYKSRVDNPDGSITFLAPMFTVLGGKKSISITSDNNGVCKLYGAGPFISRRTIKTHGTAELPVIDRYGRLYGVKKFVDGQTYWHITCGGGQAGPSDQYASLKRNDDGSVTISSPRFDMFGKKVYTPIAIASEGTGVCRLFGYNIYVTRGQIKQMGIHETAIIGANGRFSGTEVAEDPYKYDYIVCAWPTGT